MLIISLSPITSLSLPRLQMLRACGICIRKDEVDDVLRTLGIKLKRRSGCSKADAFTFNDFRRIYLRTHDKMRPNRANLTKALKTFDKNGDGTASMGELQHVMTHCGEKIEKKVFAEFVGETPIDGTGQFDYAKFARELEF